MTSISSMSSGAPPWKPRPDGAVDAGVHHHGGQAQSGAQADAMGSHLVQAVFHRGKALRRRVSTGIHLVSQLLHQHFQLVELGVTGCKVQGDGD
jgi:hypothetical protein